MTDEFYLAAVPDEQPRMLGLQLRPLSLGHLILLHRYGSNFVSETPKDPGFEDLAISILVCSMTYRKGVELMHQDLFQKMWKWHDRITGCNRWLVRLGWKKPNLINLREECEKFARYLKDNSKVPYYSFDPGDFREMHCPAVQHVRVKLMRDLHFTEDQLMDRPWIACMWDYVTLKACDGEVTMQNRDDFEDAMEAGRKLAQMIAEGKVKPRGGAK